ncbi:MAG: heme o synthase [Crocinitomicaceae bacterium]|nr:heme o synthase [Crocinitomicaceae bacterium]MCF8410338.1 heme o synthase [Crocinitomicaceae bacterium]MCF8443803.1 heme o synthase [Crocinitomicaceae bacterium]
MEESKAIQPGKFKTYLIFTKFRLSSLVILSAIAGYLFAGGSDITELILLTFGGIFVTGASNGANQIWEQHLDKLMNRTNRRPLPQGWMTNKEAYSVVVISLIIGTAMLFAINLFSALLGLFAFVSYVFIYTPMKQVSSWAVLIGAFPGAIPPFLGAIAATNDFGLLPGVLFFVQFTWQFPHFWAIAWILHEDYQRAGFHLLPSKTGKTKNSAFQIMIYSLALIPFSLIPWLMGWCGTVTLVLASCIGILFFLYSYKLFITCEDKDARKLMFASFVYLPIIQFVYVFDRVEPMLPK